MHSLPARQGLTGFCYETLDVKECLAIASKEAGFNSVNPWSWLPIFARWPLDQPIPTTGAEVVRYLSTAVFEIAYALPGSGIPRERSSNGLQPLVECKDCDNPDGPSETDAVGRGIGWFIPLR